MKRYNYKHSIAQCTNQVFRDDFPGSALRSYWRTPVVANGATVTVGSSNMVISLPTTSGAKATVVSQTTFTIPCRLSISLLLSGRYANQTIKLELISKNYYSSGGTEGHYCRWNFDGTTATTAKTRTRNTDTDGTEVSRTIATTAAITRLFNIDLGYDDVKFSQMDVDSVAARGAVFIHTAKVPAADEEYYISISCENTGASTALTATVDFVAVQDIEELMTEIVGGMGFNTAASAMPVVQQGTATVNAAQTAHDSAISGNPVRIGTVARTSITAVSATGDAVNAPATMYGYPVVRLNSIPEYDWQFACTAAIANTADVVLTASAGAGLRNYVTSIQIKGTNAVATEVVIKDGSTVIWRGHLNASMVNTDSIQFQTPLRGSAAAALNFACITTGTAVYVSAQGYKAP